MLDVSPGRQVEVDAEGFLVRLEDWDADVFSALCRACGVEATDVVRGGVDYVREYVSQHGCHPPLRQFLQARGLRLPEIYHRFGCARNIWRLSGLAKPTGCV